jgi:aspartate/methionine/tyrosine aminotransferase
MHAPRVDLFDWLHTNAPKATYNLAYSNIYGLTAEEYQRYCRYSLPNDFDLGINEAHGAKEFIQTLSKMYQCLEENIVTTTGASEANYLVFSSLLEPGDEFIIEQPSYQPMWLTLEMLGGKRVSWPRRFESKYQLDLETLEPLITNKTKLIVLTNLHNPSGVWTDRRTMDSVTKIAEDHGCYVVVDEIYLDGGFKRNPSSFGLPQIIVTSSTTKVYGLGGLHTGWIVAPAEIAKECQRRKAHTTGASSFVSEVMTSHALGAAREKLITRFQNRAEENIGILRKWMREHRDILDWVEPEGGIVCFPRYHLSMPSVPLCKRLLDETGVLVNPGAFFNEEGHFRLAYGIESEMLSSALQMLGDALERFKSNS